MSERATPIAMVVALLCLSGCAPSATVQVEDQPWAVSFVTCMADKGWTVEVADDGGVEGAYVESQASAFRTDSDTCNEAARNRRPLTEQVYEDHFAALLVTRGCVIEQGYDLAPAPSYQAWRDEGARWSPHRELMDNGISDGEFAALDEACPQAVD